MMLPKGCAVLFLAIALLLSGCFDPDAGLSPEEQVSAAVERFPSDLGPDGDVQKLDGEATVEGMNVALVIEFGAAEALRMSVDAGMIQIDVVCVDDRVFFSYGGETYESRPKADGCELEMEEGPEMPFADEDVEWEIVSFEERDDGTIEATVRITEDGEETVMRIIVSNGRIIELTVEDDEGEMTFTVTYGKRKTIAAPQADGRLPASVEWDSDFGSGTYTGTLTEVDDQAALDEFEVQVLDRAGGNEAEVLASFPAEDDGTQTQGGFSFLFEDDGDGLLSAGDRFTLTHDDWEQAWDHEVAFYDTWAGMRTDETPLPAPGLAWLVLALLGFVPFARRR